MYEAFYDLRVKPFQTRPDPAFLYWSDAHLMAFTMLRYGIMNSAQLTVITGEVGAGKTTLLRQMLEEFPHDLTVGLISNMQAGRGDLMEWVLMSFGLPYDGGHVAWTERFQNFVIETYAAGKQAVLVIDEAEQLCGIVSERDVVRALAEQAAQALAQPVSSIMSSNLVVCAPEHDMEFVMACMTDRRIRHLPVLREGRLAGIISIGDVVRQRIMMLESQSQNMRDYIEAREWRYLHAEPIDASRES